MADFRGHPAELQKVLDSAARTIVTRRAVGVLQSAKAGASDAVKDDLGYTVSGSSYKDIVARVGANSIGALIEEEGAKPFIIRPRNGKFLKFPGTKAFAGTIVFTKVVHHPGVKAKHYLTNALHRVIRSR